MLCWISQFNVDGFSWDLYKRDYLDDMMEMRGNNPMLTSKLHVLLNILALCWHIFTRLLKQGFFCWDNQNEGQKPYANFKTAHFVEYLSSMLMDFHKTSIMGILLIRLLKMSCIWKTFCIILCFLHLIFTFMHIHIYIHTCMLMWMTTIFQCQMCSPEINVHVIS